MYALILNYNDWTTTKACISNLRKFNLIKKILIIDNDSKDGSYEILKKEENEKIIVRKAKLNKGYGSGNNLGINILYSMFRAEYILLSNPDVIVEEEVLYAMKNFLDLHKDYSIVAPFMMNNNKERKTNTAFKIPTKIQYILSYFYIIRKYSDIVFYCDIFTDTSNYKTVDALSGSMFLMRTKDMIKCGMFDEKIFLYWEELCIAIQMKKIHKKLALLTQYGFIHNHSVSISKVYKNELTKYRLQLNSKMYILEKYYKINKIEKLICLLFEKISIFEMYLILKLKSRLR